MSTHVLVYDHSAVILANFQQALQQAGFRVTGRFPREINLDEVRKHSPDVIVLGLVETQYGNALERMIQIHDEPLAVHIPMIVATPHHQQMRLKLPEAGMIQIPYTERPFQVDNVIAAIHTLMQPKS